MGTMTINDKLFALLKEKGITQKELSKMTGIPESTISDWKRKGKTPGADKVIEVCKALGINSNELIGGASADDASGENSDMHALISKIRKLDLGKQQRLIRYLDLLIQEGSIASEDSLDL